MAAYLTPLLQLQRFFIPGLLVLLAWAIWKTVREKDTAVGLVLYMGLVIIVDSFFNTGIFLPFLKVGSIRYSEVCALVILFGHRRSIGERSPRRMLFFLLWLYFGLLLLSALRAEPTMSGILDFRRIVVPQMIALFVAQRGLGGPEDYRRFFLWLTALVLILGLFVFWDVFFDRWLLKSEMLAKPEYYVNRKHGRFGGVFLNPNYLGAFVVLVFPFALLLTLSEAQRKFRVMAWSGLLALAFCLVETQSRGPLLGFGVAVLLIVFGPIQGLSRARRLGFLMLFVMTFSIAMPGFMERATGRFTATALEMEQTVEEASRESNWQYTLRIIEDHPFGGIGFGEEQFRREMRDYGFLEEYGRLFDNPHNSYLQMAVYAGIPALVVFLLANLSLLGRAGRLLLGRALDWQAPMVYGIAVGLIGFLVCIFPDMHLFTQSVAPIYWLFFGLLISLTGQPASRARRK